MEWNVNKKFMMHRQLTISQISVLCSKLSIMLDSGLNVHSIFYNLEFESNSTFLKFVMRDIRKSMLSGKSLYESMKKFNGKFPPYMLEMINVGEHCGKLENILKELSEYYERQNELYSNLRSALLYPLITLVTAICVAIFLMENILPQFIDIITMNNAKIPCITYIIVHIFKFLKENFLVICIVQFILLFSIHRFSKIHKGKYIMDKIKMKFPFIGNIYNNISLFKFISSMKILNDAGINIIKSLYITEKTLNNTVMSLKIKRIIEIIRSGESINYAFENQKLGDNLFLSMIKSGEEVGKLDIMFDKLRIILQQDINRKLKTSINLVEPFSIIFLSVFIGIFVIAVIMPVFSIMDSIL